MKLFLKGTKCFSDKCPIEKRNFAPGQHGKDRKAKIVGYGLQLREKQKAKRMYFTQEGQFRNYFEKAARSKGVTGELLLQQLERRLDAVVYRIGLGMSRRQARQLVRHGHVAAHQNAPGWLEIDRENFKGKVLALPKREDIHLPVNEQLIVELYSK